MAHVDSICAKWLYRLNAATQTFVSAFNAIYGLSPATRYLSMQVRSFIDKRAEMDPHQCKLSSLSLSRPLAESSLSQGSS